MPDCLLCQIAPTRPEELAGLCVSCRALLKHGDAWVMCFGESQGSQIYIALAPATPLRPLGYEQPYPDSPLPAYLYDPPAASAEIRREYIAELLSATYGPPFQNDYEAARFLVRQLREAGVIVALLAGEGRAILENPRTCPYPLLVRFLELQIEVEDVLTRERRDEIVQLEQNAKDMRNYGSGDDGTNTEANREPGEDMSALPSGEGDEAAGAVLDLLLHTGSEALVPVKKFQIRAPRGNGLFRACEVNQRPDRQIPPALTRYLFLLRGPRVVRYFFTLKTLR